MALTMEAVTSRSSTSHPGRRPKGRLPVVGWGIFDVLDLATGVLAAVQCSMLLHSKHLVRLNRPGS